MKLLAQITAPDSLARYLAPLGELLQAPPLLPPRAPPVLEGHRPAPWWPAHDTIFDDTV